MTHIAYRERQPRQLGTTHLASGLEVPLVSPATKERYIKWDLTEDLQKIRGLVNLLRTTLHLK